MHTENEIWINASPGRVFELASDIARWPSLLPHYRWVRVLKQTAEARTAEMSARRAWFPVKWTAEQRLAPEEGVIRFRHLRGLTVGMEVEWRLAPVNGGTQVVIVHDLDSRRWLLRTRLAQWIVGDFFVKGIAARTLAHVKLAAER